MDEPTWWKVEQQNFDYDVLNSIDGHVHMLVKHHMWAHKGSKSILLEYCYRKVFAPDLIFNHNLKYNLELCSLLSDLKTLFPLKYSVIYNEDKRDTSDYQNSANLTKLSIPELFDDCKDQDLRDLMVEVAKYLKIVIDTLRKKEPNFLNVDLQYVPPEALPFNIPNERLLKFIYSFEDNYNGFAYEYFTRCMKLVANPVELSKLYTHHMNVRAGKIISKIMFSNDLKLSIKDFEEYQKELNKVHVKFQFVHNDNLPNFKWYLDNEEPWSKILHLPVSFDPWPEIDSLEKLKLIL